MRSPEWLLSWWDIYAEPGDSLHIVLVMDPDGALVGLAPLYRQDAGVFLTLRVLGTKDHCSHHTDWLSTRGWALRVGEAVANFLFQTKVNWNRLILESVDADAIAIRSTMKYLTEGGCLGHLRQINSCWKINLPGSWEEYLSMLSRSLRKRCRKLQRQFFESGKITLRQAEDEASLREGFDVLLKLHAARWGTPRQPFGIFSERKFRMFHEILSKVLLADRQLRLAWLECEGKPIAAEYQFFDTESVYAYQAGIDLSMDEYAPGKLSMMAAIRFAIEKGCKSFDLLGGNEPYKSNWRAEPMICHDLRIWQRSLRGVSEWMMWSLYTMAVSRLKPAIPDRLASSVFKLFRSIKEVCEPLRKFLR